MSNKINDGGPAFPNSDTLAANRAGLVASSAFDPGSPERDNAYMQAQSMSMRGMSLRDWFAGQMQADDRLVKCIRAMDDTALEQFALFPDSEREDWITDTDIIEGKTRWEAMTEVEKVTARLKLEAEAIAIVRYMQADAMLRARGKS